MCFASTQLETRNLCVCVCSTNIIQTPLLTPQRTMPHSMRQTHSSPFRLLVKLFYSARLLDELVVKLHCVREGVVRRWKGDTVTRPRDDIVGYVTMLWPPDSDKSLNAHIHSICTEKMYILYGDWHFGLYSWWSFSAVVAGGFRRQVETRPVQKRKSIRR